MSTHQIKKLLDPIDDNDYISSIQSSGEIFSSQECNQIIELSKAQPTIESMVSDEGPSDGIDQRIRSSRHTWLHMAPDNKWIFAKIGYAIKYANQMYKFEILGCSSLQVAEYPVGGHYDWHMDIGTSTNSKRKLSLSVQLSNPSEYNGGDLEFLREVPDEVKKKYRQQGTAVIFPSFAAHRVSPVTKGTRWSIVAWIYGPPFR